MHIALLYAPALCHFNQCKDMGDVAVDAAVGEKTEDMGRMARLRRLVQRGAIGRVFKKAAVRHSAGDLRQGLIHHAACADIGVAYLGVSDLPRGQPHILAAGLQLGVRALRQQAGKIRRICHGNGIPRAGGRDAAAVHDTKYSGFFRHPRSPPSRSRQNLPA